MRMGRGRLRVWNAIALGIALVLGVGVVSGAFAKPNDDPHAVLDRYVSAINAADLDAAARIIAGTARSMGVEVSG